jgi:hypothetical protein
MGFGALWNNIYVVCVIGCHGNAVLGIWTLWDNNYNYICILL